MLTLEEALRNGWTIIDENYSKEFALVRKGDAGRFMMGLARKVKPHRRAA
jgi:hypothetical protein